MRRACRVGAIAALASLVCACADPGADALDRVVRASDALIRLAERRARGELDGPALNAAIGAWARTDGAALETIATDASRALGPALRGTLAERWRIASGPLLERLSSHHDEKAPPR